MSRYSREQSHSHETYNPAKILAVSLDESSGIVHFSDTVIGDHYTPLESVQQKQLTATAVAELKQLLSERWGQRPVASKDQVERREYVSDYNSRSWYEITGEHPMWQAPRLSYAGEDDEDVQSKWHRIEEIIEEGESLTQNV